LNRPTSTVALSVSIHGLYRDAVSVMVVASDSKQEDPAGPVWGSSCPQIPHPPAPQSSLVAPD